MGAIYLSAQYTIIAAAGESASFGLPGISRSRHFPTSEPLSTGRLWTLKQSVEHHITQTMWASRGWSKHKPRNTSHLQYALTSWLAPH
jgi:hypothetical protein